MQPMGYASYLEAIQEKRWESRGSLPAGKGGQIQKATEFSEPPVAIDVRDSNLAQILTDLNSVYLTLREVNGSLAKSAMETGSKKVLKAHRKGEAACALILDIIVLLSQGAKKKAGKKI